MQRLYLLVHVLCFIWHCAPTAQDVSVLLLDKICKSSKFEITPQTYPYNSIHLYMADRDIHTNPNALSFYTTLLTKWKVNSYTPFLNETWFFLMFLVLAVFVLFSNVFILYITLFRLDCFRVSVEKQ